MSRSGKNQLVDHSRRWRTALMHAGLTQAEWARREGPPPNGWADAHVSQVLSGKRRAEAVLSKALAFIAEQEQAIQQLPPLHGGDDETADDGAVDEPQIAAA